MLLNYKLWLYVLLTGMLLSIVACSGQGGDSESVDSKMVTNPASADGNKAENLPVASVEKSVHDFGQVIQGEVISYSFKLSNTGNAPLVIADVTSSCGCTVANYPKEAMAPGDEGFVTVTFDSKGRRGFQSKTVTVVANTVPNTIPLKIKAQVVIPEE